MIKDSSSPSQCKVPIPVQVIEVTSKKPIATTLSSPCYCHYQSSRPSNLVEGPRPGSRFPTVEQVRCAGGDRKNPWGTDRENPDDCLVAHRSLRIPHSIISSPINGNHPRRKRKRKTLCFGKRQFHGAVWKCSTSQGCGHHEDIDPHPSPEWTHRSRTKADLQRLDSFPEALFTSKKPRSFDRESSTSGGSVVFVHERIHTRMDGKGLIVRMGRCEGTEESGASSDEHRSEPRLGKSTDREMGLTQPKRQREIRITGLAVLRMR